MEPSQKNEEKRRVWWLPEPGQERTDCRGRERFKYRENAERCAGRNTGSYGSVKRHRLENEKTKEDSTTKEMEEESEHDIVIRPELWGCTFDSEQAVWRVEITKQID